jgi:hypothetical protein
MNSTQQIKLVKNPKYTPEQRQAYFDGVKSMDARENVPLDKLQFAVDENGDGQISQDEWVQDAAVLSGDQPGLYLGQKPGFFGSLIGKKPEFHKADGWIEVPDSGPVRYDTKMLRSIDQQNQTAEIATVFTIPYLRESLYIKA